MALIGKIRGMRMRDGKSISEISRLTSLSRNTIKKWLKAPGAAVPKYRRREGLTKLTPFAATLQQALETDAHRPRHERRTARALHSQIETWHIGPRSDETKTRRGSGLDHASRSCSALCL